MYFALVRSDSHKEGNPVYVESIEDKSIVQSIEAIGGVISLCIGVIVELEDQYNRNKRGFIVAPEENGKFVKTLNGYSVFVPNKG